MRALVEAVATSIVAEVSGANGWKVEKYDPLWRNPDKGKVLNVYASRRIPGEQPWTGSADDIVEITLEYCEASGTQATRLDRDQAAELAAEEVADSLRTWAAAHEEGFSPAWKMDWVETAYAPEVPRELMVRYCRLVLHLHVMVSFT